MTVTSSKAPVKTATAHKADSSRAYLGVHFDIAETWFDLLSAALQETGCVGLEYRDGDKSGTVSIDAYFQDSANSGSVMERLLPWLRTFGAESGVRCDPVADCDWNQLWKSTYRPVEIGDRIVILPSWTRRRFPGKLPIRIRPEQAFGTGSHETTHLCLEALAAAALNNKSVADVGTGSGILAIAAARLGAASVYACDPDPLALANARHNLRLNRVEHKIELSAVELDALPNRQFDVIIANLVLDPLRAGMAHLASASRERADVFLSGLLKGQDDELLPVAERLGFEQVSRRFRNDWVLLHLKAPGSVAA